MAWPACSPKVRGRFSSAGRPPLFFSLRLSIGFEFSAKRSSDVSRTARAQARGLPAFVWRGSPADKNGMNRGDYND